MKQHNPLIYKSFVKQCWGELPPILQEYLMKNTVSINSTIAVVWALYNHISDANSDICSSEDFCKKSKTTRQNLIRIWNNLYNIGIFDFHFNSFKTFEGYSFNKKICKALSINMDGGHIFLFVKDKKTIKHWIDLPEWIKEKNIKTKSLVFYEFTNKLITELQKPSNERCSFYKNNYSSNFLDKLQFHGIIYKVSNPVKKQTVHRYNLTRDAEVALSKERASGSTETIKEDTE